MPGKFSALLTLLFLAAPTPIPGQAPPLDKAERIDHLVSHYQRLGYFNGAILVADHGKSFTPRG